MTRFLLISVRFLDDRYHGLTENGEKAEWPPSPFRLFQALIAGNACGVNIPDPTRAALRWLESLAPPVIIAPTTCNGRPLLTYVLNNVSDSNLNSRAPKVIRPTLLNGDRLIQYLWKYDGTADECDRHAGVISEAARHIRCLGWGIDLAVGCGEVLEKPPAPTASRIQYRPSLTESVNGTDLRTPRPGSLLSLERGYSDFLRRYEEPGITKLEAAGAIYEPQHYVTGASRPAVAFRLVNADGDTISLRHQLIAPLVGMVRNLANRPLVVESIGQDIIDRDIKGHPKESSVDRVSILPLPTIRNGPTDGRIRRLLLAQSCESDGTTCRLLGRLFDGQELKPLSDEDRFPPLYLERIDRPKTDKVLSYYTDISRAWASVTPVLLPGYDDRKDHRGDHVKRLARAEKLVRKAMIQAGVDAAATIELSRVPFWAGALHAPAYRPREKLADYPRWHVRLIFDRPWTGPLAIGAGRHAGFGVMAACGED